MFDFDNLREIFGTMKRNKLRTFLTGFAVSWGIFILIILLGAGNGLRNGVMKNFENWSQNRIVIYAGSTDKPYAGFQRGRRIRFTYKDFEDLSVFFPEIDKKTVEQYLSDTLKYNNEYSVVSLRGVHPAKAEIDFLKMESGNGRFINEIDVSRQRKVVVISQRTKEILFKEENPIGKRIIIRSVPFQVIGVYSSEDNSYETASYIPVSTAITMYNPGPYIHDIVMTVNGVDTKEAVEDLEKRLRLYFARRHHFDPEDMSAIGMGNTLENFQSINIIMNGLSLMIWLIGIGTLTAGIVGVSNIMLITVKERTREFGIRKAIGATPFSILRMIVFESVLITSVFGYVGMITGIGVTEAINVVVESMNNSGDGNGGFIFANPTVDLGIAISSTVLLIIAGVVAGYFPARIAVSVSAIESMRVE